MNQNNSNLSNIFKSGMFSSTPKKENTPSPFGTSSTTNQNPFASQQTFGNTNLFQSGNAIGSQNTLGNQNALIQNPLNSQNPSGSQSSYFNPPKPQGSVFGSSGSIQPLNPPQTSSFGTQPSTSWGSTSFGNKPSFGSTQFGTTQSLPTTTLSFSNTTAPSFGTTTTPSFGITPSSFNPTSTAPFGSGFQNTSLSIGALKNGTRDTPYQDTRIKDGIGTIEIKHINAMNEYTRKSNDELRQEDYTLGRKAITTGGVSSNTGFSNIGFGNTAGFSDAGNTAGFGTGNTGIGKILGFGNTGFGTSTNTLPALPSTNPSLPPTTNNHPSFSFNKFSSNQPTTSQPLNSQQASSPFQTQGNIFNTQPSTTTPQQQPSTFPSTSLFSTSVGVGTSNKQTQTPFGNPFSNIMPNNNTILNNNTMPNNTAFNNTTLYNTTMPMNSTFVQTPSSLVDYEDPFLLKDIKFEKVEKKSIPVTRIIPKPIFSDTVKKPLINLQYRLPKINHKKKIYTEPTVKESRHLKEVENLLIGFDGKGRIQYIDKVLKREINITNIEDKISFMKNEILVSDLPGQGLNKRARVYVEGVYAFSKSQGDYIIGKTDKQPLKTIQERFVYNIKNDPTKKFIDYNYETGMYVYEVNHF